MRFSLTVLFALSSGLAGACSGGSGQAVDAGGGDSLPGVDGSDCVHGGWEGADPYGCPMQCPIPACGSDGTIHPDICSASGVDFNGFACEGASLAGFFPCGGVYCKVGKELCEENTGNGSRIGACLALPSACVSAQVCSCLDATSFLCGRLQANRCMSCSDVTGHLVLTWTSP